MERIVLYLDVYQTRYTSEQISDHWLLGYVDTACAEHVLANPIAHAGSAVRYHERDAARSLFEKVL